MGLDFDAVEYCKNVKQEQSQPPYACPVSKCDRSYKTVVGLQYHLLNYDHDNPQPLTPILTQNRKRARARGTHHSTPKTPKGVPEEAQSGKTKQVSNPESLVTYNDDEQTVQFNLDGKSVRLGIDEPLPFIEDDEYTELIGRGCILNADALPLEENASWARVQVPEARFKEIADYNVPDAPPRPLAYYRFIEKSTEELDGEIEYDVDEEDSAWLEWINEQREKGGFNPVSIDTMELLMDRLEKESFFQAAANGTATGGEVDDDAVCCICLDGECQNTNVILFCDMCNLAVHQDCYGVPYIPEGQWLCRRCLQSPSTPVSCVLCPNAGGAFKQTDRSQWAHVVCALWIPEVRFANTVFLEPIDSIETIPAARWRLTCYVCKEKSMGACIQCHRNSCYAAFHVTCAQQAGLYMTMDTVKDGHNDSSVHVQKFAYCHSHTPADAKLKTNQKEVEDTRHKMKEARKALAKKRSTAPMVLIPTIPSERVQDISTMVHMQRKQQFLDRLIAYWTLKRQYRNGVPLLRRLQSQGNHHGVIHRNGIEGTPDTTELYRQLKYWQCLRQDLERARLLCELVRKREKLKAALVKIYEKVVMLQLNPVESALTKLLDALESKDTSEIFREPVDTEEVPDYLDIVKHPIDLGTMRDKLKNSMYTSLEQLESDFDLMIQNCLAYNNKDTVFYRAGIRMRDQAAPLFQQVQKDLQRAGLLQHNHSVHSDHVEMEIEEELKELLDASASEEIIQKLLILADKSQVLKNPNYRTKKIKQIRMEITRVRKVMLKPKSINRNSIHMPSHSEDDDHDKTPVRKKHSSEKHKHSSHHSPVKRTRKTPANPRISDDDDTMEEESKDTPTTIQTPPCSPIKNLNNSASPVGVNRRTAVLFTRKAQAALKRPSEATTPVKEESMSGTTVAQHANSLSSGVSSNSLALTSSAISLSQKLGSGHMTGIGNLGMNSTLMSRKSPKRNPRNKRLSEMRHSTSMSPKKSPNTGLSSATANDLSYEHIPDSFRVYRANNDRDGSDSEDNYMSDISGSRCSSCSDFSISGTDSEYDSSDEDEDDEDGDRQSDDDDGENGDDDEYDADEADQDNELNTHNAAGGNVPVMSCSGDSDSESVDDLNDTNIMDGKSIAMRTPTPSEKRSQSNHKKQKRRHVSNSENDNETINNSTSEQLAKTHTRSTNKQSPGIQSMTASTTANNNTSLVNNTKSKKLGNHKSKLNNIPKGSSETITPTSTIMPTLPPAISLLTPAPMIHTSSKLLKPPLEPLQLVWAKCRGYPWYPALILDPKTPKGFVYNGVPLPAPPTDVLALRKNCSEDIAFLVLFFDAKRTWQWLPAKKLEILGIDKQLDQQKLVESRKPTERKAVKKAYQDALHYQSQVSDLEGQGPDPIM